MLAYVPGSVPVLGEGHVTNWPAPATPKTLTFCRISQRYYRFWVHVIRYIQQILHILFKTDVLGRQFGPGVAARRKQRLARP